MFVAQKEAAYISAPIKIVINNKECIRLTSQSIEVIMVIKLQVGRCGVRNQAWVSGFSSSKTSRPTVAAPHIPVSGYREILPLVKRMGRELLLLLRWRYSPGWALASFTIRLQASRSFALSLHSFILIFLRSVDTSSNHLIFGLPLRLVPYSFPYNIFFGIIFPGCSMF